MRGTVSTILGWVLCLGLAACGGGGTPIDVPRERLASAEARARGRQLYVAYCSRCHGENADGEGVGASVLTSPPRDFTSEAWQVRAKPEQVFVVIRRGVPGTSMPAWGFLPEGELWDLTAYLLSLDGNDATTESSQSAVSSATRSQPDSHTTM